MINLCIVVAGTENGTERSDDRCGACSLLAMLDDSDGLPLFAYAEMVWRRRILVLVVALGMAVPAYAVSALQAPVYLSSAALLLAQQDVDADYNVGTTVLSDVQIDTQIAILTSVDVTERAVGEGATSVVRAVGSDNSNVIALTATGSTPQQAADTVEAYISAYSGYRVEQIQRTLTEATDQLEEGIAQLQAEASTATLPADRASIENQLSTLTEQLGRLQIQEGITEAGVTVVQRAVVSDQPISPSPLRDVLLALVIGLALGISLAVLLETIRRRSAQQAADGQVADRPAGEKSVAGSEADPQRRITHPAPMPAVHETQPVRPKVPDRPRRPPSPRPVIGSSRSAVDGRN